MAAEIKFIYPPNFNYGSPSSVGTRRMVVQVSDTYLEADYALGQIVDISEILTTQGLSATRTIIDSIDYDVANCACVLTWDRRPISRIAVLEGHDTIDYSKVGGNADSGSSGDGTGDIMLEVTNVNPDATYTIQIAFRTKG